MLKLINVNIIWLYVDMNILNISIINLYVDINICKFYVNIYVYVFVLYVKKMSCIWYK